MARSSFKMLNSFIVHTQTHHTQSSMDGHLSYFHVLPIMNSGHGDAGVIVRWWFHTFCVCAQRSYQIGAYGSSCCNLWRSLHVFSQSICTVLSLSVVIRGSPFSQFLADMCCLKLLDTNYPGKYELVPYWSFGWQSSWWLVMASTFHTIGHL